MLATAIPVHPSLIFAGKVGAYLSGALMRVQPNGRLLALPENIRLGWKLMAVANTLTFYNAAAIMAVKSFIVQAPYRKTLGCLPLPFTFTQV